MINPWEDVAEYTNTDSDGKSLHKIPAPESAPRVLTGENLAADSMAFVADNIREDVKAMAERAGALADKVRAHLAESAPSDAERMALLAGDDLGASMRYLANTRGFLDGEELSAVAAR
jgi:hypothetical protein